MVLMKQPSPYSLMYLVTPAIYEKLLLCLDEGDKRLLDSLNKPKSDELKRPSEEIADIITSSEVAQSGNFNTSLVKTARFLVEIAIPNRLWLMILIISLVSNN